MNTEYLRYGAWKRRFRPRVTPSGESCTGFDRYWHADERTIPTDAKNGHMWTVHDGEGTSIWLSNGVGLVDRLGYVVCEKMWPNGAYIVVTFE